MSMNYYQELVDKIRSIDSANITDEIVDAQTRIIEEQVVYLWMRLYLKEEISDLKEGDDFKMIYSPSGEHLICKFVAYGKIGLDKDSKGEILNYNPEDNKKILCLMVNEDHIKNRKDIPFIRTLFRTSPYFEYQVIRRNELTFENQRNNLRIDYYDVDF